MSRRAILMPILLWATTMATACSNQNQPDMAPIPTARSPSPGVTVPGPRPAATPAATRSEQPTQPVVRRAELEPMRDATLYEDARGSLGSGSGKYLFVGRNGNGDIRRTLIAFDVAGKIPAGAQIIAATLSMHMSQTTSGPQRVELHRALAAWGEGASVPSANGGGGATAAPGDATWLYRFFDSERWSSPGGDFSPKPIAATSVGAPGVYAWGSGPDMVADVQSMLDMPGSHFGWVMVGEESFPRTSKRFGSRESDKPEDRPVLSVQYHS